MLKSRLTGYIHVRSIDMMYGISMSGASVIRFPATGNNPVACAVIDAGITPYPWLWPICRLIALRDRITVMPGQIRARQELAAPPERWMPAGEDPEEADT
ncbi:MAG: hypothetical protein IJ088_05615 [Clostridia bacterium]|nr:hypothetical protein [Clostridia bacterium]